MKIKIIANDPQCCAPTEDVTPLIGQVFEAFTIGKEWVVIDAGQPYGQILLWHTEYEEVKE